MEMAAQDHHSGHCRCRSITHSVDYKNASDLVINPNPSPMLELAFKFRIHLIHEVQQEHDGGDFVTEEDDPDDPITFDCALNHSCNNDSQGACWAKTDLLDYCLRHMIATIRCKLVDSSCSCLHQELTLLSNYVDDLLPKLGDKAQKVEIQADFQVLKTYLYSPDQEMEDDGDALDGTVRAAVEALKTKRFTKSSTHEKDCPICIEEFKEQVQVVELPCDHVFHSACLTNWLSYQRNSCPLCRFELLTF